MAPPRLKLAVPEGERAARVEGDAFHHLVRVLRRRPGDEVELFDGEGTTWPARVLLVAASHATVEVGAPHRESARPGPILVQGLPKGAKVEWVLQKATELGAATVRLTPCERSVVAPEPGRRERRLERWTRIVEEAARQSGRARVPRIELDGSLEETLAALGAPDRGALLLLEPDAAETLWSRLEGLAAPPALLVGPEGGFSDAERTLLRDAGAVAVRLGANILRTETAALAALAVVAQHGAVHDLPTS